MKDEDKDKEVLLFELRSLRAELGQTKGAHSKDQLPAMSPAGDLFYRTIIEDLTELISRFLPDGTIKFVNDAYCRFYGEAPDELIGKTFWHHMPEEDRKSLRGFLSSFNPEDRVKTIEHKVMDSAGVVRWLQWTDRAFFDAAGNIVEFQAVGRDITEHKHLEAALRHSEKTHRAFVEGLPDILMRFDRDGRHLFVSDNVRSVVDIDVARFIGKTHRELGFPEAQCRLWELAIHEAFHSAKLFETEFVFEGKRGQTVFNWRLIPEFDEHGSVRSVLSLARDITAQRQAEQDYQTLFREMLDGFALHEIICDKQGNPVDYRFLAVNPAFERITGLKAPELVGRRVVEVMPGIEPHWIETYGRVALTGEPAFFENYAADLQRYFEVMAFRPAPGQFACIFTDITERKLAEEELRAHKDYLTSVFRSAPVGIGVVKDRVITQVNERLCEITGYSQEEIVNQGARMLYPSDGDYDDVGREKYRQIRERGTGTVETRFQRKDGRIIDVLLSSTPMDLNDLSKGVTFTALDITERRRAEEEREKLQAQLLQAQKIESVGRLAGGVAHDFNNMLSVILGHTEMALDHLNPGQPLHYDLLEIRKAAERSADLTRQLLAFARKQTIAPKVLDLNDTVEGMLKMLRRLIGEDIDLHWLPGAGLWPVHMDPSQIDQILANLCVNARDAIAGVGKITIETGNATLDEAYCAGHPGFIQGDHVLLAVSDDGCGMDKETMERLFEPFFTTKGVGRGTGLGLATVYGVVKQNSGFINVYSEPGRGTTFKIYLPRHTGGAEQASEKGPTESTVRGHETILLVEDEPAILQMTARMLQRMGYTVLVAGRPGEAMRLAREHAGEIHLLMTDVVMPEMNGRDLAKNLLSIYPDIKRLFMSGYTANVIAHHGVLDEGVQFIQKPFSQKDLAAKVMEALDRNPAEA